MKKIEHDNGNWRVGNCVGREQSSDVTLINITTYDESQVAIGGGQIRCLPCTVSGVGLQWVQVPPGNWVAPAGSYRSGGGGNETVEAFETTGRLGRLGEQAGRNGSERCASPETTRYGSRPGCSTGKAVVPGDRGGYPSRRDTLPGSHRGIGGGMPAHGDPTQHGKPRAVSRVNSTGGP